MKLSHVSVPRKNDKQIQCLMATYKHIIEVKVIPSSRTSTIYVDKTGKLCICLTNVPENGKANQELIKMIAKRLKISRSDVEIIFGEKSRLKRLSVSGNFLNKEKIIDKLVPARQQALF